MVVAGVFTYAMVSSTLAAENITVADDAKHFAGEDVKGPFTAVLTRSDIIAQPRRGHGSDGQTYAELEQDDPTPSDG